MGGSIPESWRPTRKPTPVYAKPVTLREVAALAGVSVATASKALNGHGRMTAETRERIRETARRLGFRPNSLAQSLLRRRSFTIGLLTNDTYGRFSLPVMSAFRMRWSTRASRCPSAMLRTTSASASWRRDHCFKQ